jgi:hypothetical protein
MEEEFTPLSGALYHKQIDGLAMLSLRWSKFLELGVSGTQTFIEVNFMFQGALLNSVFMKTWFEHRKGLQCSNSSK